MLGYWSSCNASCRKASVSDTSIMKAVDANTPRLDGNLETRCQKLGKAGFSWPVHPRTLSFSCRSGGTDLVLPSSPEAARHAGRITIRGVREAWGGTWA